MTWWADVFAASRQELLCLEHRRSLPSYANGSHKPIGIPHLFAYSSVKSTLGEHFQRWWGTLMHPPGSVTTNKGHTSHVFTPFFTRWSGLPLPRWPQPVRAQIADDMGDGLPVMVSRPFQAGGEQAAMGRLFEFAEKVEEYEEPRNRPNLSGTSCLSADLHFGVLAPRTVAAVVGTSTRGRAAFVRQLAWRDWYAHLLREMPRLVATPLRADSIELAWQNDATDLEAWQNGLTGYPLVDAGIRQLRATGWMHNRVRMVVASFLIKDLLIDWRIGERWFRRCLVDGDIAQNTGNWQWIAGTGPDAAPYFRVFNPVLQSRKFDPEGTYIRRFVPELAAVPSKWIHAPWAALPMDLALFGVTLGDTYPYPIVDHTFARERALGAHQATRQGPLK
jgi:deoxyribodipyrimidine photo-lyase